MFKRSSGYKEMPKETTETMDKDSLETEDLEGTIFFQGISRKSLVNFVKLSSERAEENLDHIYNVMSLSWGLGIPKILVSVAGHEDTISGNVSVLTSFKRIVQQISKIPGAWIITNGLHSGISKHVGDAVSLQTASRSAVCIGVTAWGNIKDRNKLCKIPGDLPNHSRIFPYNVGSMLKSGSEVGGEYLDQNHSHFVLFNEKLYYGDAMKFRAEFEVTLVEKYKIPYLLVVFNGGRVAVDMIFEAIARRYRIVLVKGSGGVADLITESLAESDGVINDSFENPIEMNNISDYGINAVLKMCQQNKDLFITISDGDTVESFNNIIVNDLLYKEEQQSVHGELDRFKLALALHDPKLLKKFLGTQQNSNLVHGVSTLNSSTIFIGDTMYKKMERLMVMALAYGDMWFVNMLLTQYEIDISQLLSMNVLKIIYGFQSHRQNFPTSFAGLKDSDYINVYDVEEPQRECVLDMFMWHPNRSLNPSARILSRDGINKLRWQFFGVSGVQESEDHQYWGLTEPGVNRCRWFCCVDCGTDNSAVVLNPMWELFVWASVCNLPDMAKLFWASDGNHIAKGLIAWNYWERLAKTSLCNNANVRVFEECREEFKALSCKLLDDCHHEDKYQTDRTLTTAIDPLPGSSALELGIHYKLNEFMTHNAVQNIFHDFWTGKIQREKALTAIDYLQLLLAIFFPCLIGKWYIFMPNEPNSSESVSFKQKMKNFYLETPAVRFLIHGISFVLFLTIYSYMLFALRHGGSMFCEIITFLFVLNYLTSEIYKTTHCEIESSSMRIPTLIFRFCRNKWTVINIFVFFLATLLRCSLASENTGFVLHALNCGVWIIRGSTALIRLNSTFGPYIEEVVLMTLHLINFMVLLVILVFTYAIVAASLFYSGQSDETFFSIILRPWFYMCGEMFFEVENGGLDVGENRYLLWIITSIFFGITNIILLSHVIALFSSEYSEVKLQSERRWRSNTFHSMIDYSRRLALPPPFCLFYHMYVFFRWAVKCCRKKEEESSKSKPKSLVDSRLKIYGRNRTSEERVKLLLFESNHAFQIHEKHFEIVNGKVIVRGIASQTGSTQVTYDILHEIEELKRLVEFSDGSLKKEIEDVKWKIMNNVTVL